MPEGVLLYGREKWTIKKYAGSEGDVVVEKNDEDDPNKNKRHNLVGNRIRKNIVVKLVRRLKLIY